MKKLGWVWEIVLIMGAMVVLRSSLVNWYVIPTGSMLPTIKLGDHVIVNKLEYGLMLPFAESQIISWDSPKRGDIVLFRSPVESVTLVKRVIGLPGDQVSFSSGTLRINGESVTEDVQAQRQILEDMGESGAGKTLYIENGNLLRSHFMLRSNEQSLTVMETREWRVPEGKVFVLGDNRDASNDSRFWGFVDIDRIYGRARWIFYSTIPGEGLLPVFRTDRFFGTLDSEVLEKP